MSKKSIISVVVIFVLSMGLGFLVHGVLLAPDYSKFAGTLFRTPEDSEKYFSYMLIAHVIMAVGFVWIYIKGKEDKPFVMQGIRFGIAVALLMTIPTYLIYYAVQPLPGEVVLKQIVFDSMSMLLMGIVVAWLNK